MTRVAIVDGPLGADCPGVVAERRFCEADGAGDAARHAGALAMTIRHHAGEADLVAATVFPGRLVTSVSVLAEALDWLMEEPPDLVLCAFGLARASGALAARIEALIAAGAVIVASAPARGGSAYPAAFSGVISVQGDARCGPDALSLLDLEHATFGACPVAEGDGAVRGASAAAAHLTGLLARQPTVSAAAVRDLLAPSITFRGRERRDWPSAGVPTG